MQIGIATAMSIVLSFSDYEIARAIEALAILLDVQSWAGRTEAARIVGTVVVTVRSRIARA